MLNLKTRPRSIVLDVYAYNTNIKKNVHAEILKRTVWLHGRRCSHERLRFFSCFLFFMFFSLGKVSLIGTFVIALGVVFC